MQNSLTQLDSVIHNQLQSDAMSKVHETEREKIKRLAASIAELKTENMPMSAKVFMARLRDSFELQVAPVEERHSAMVAVPEPRGNLPEQQRSGKKHQDRRDPSRPTVPKTDQEPRDHNGKSVDQKINDLFSIVGQAVKKIDQMSDRGQENRPPNGRQDRYRNRDQDGYKDKQRRFDSREDSGRGQRYERYGGQHQKQFAGKAQAQKSKKGKTTFKRGNSSDDDYSSDEDDHGQHKAYYAYLAQGKSAMSKAIIDHTEDSSPTFKLYGQGPTSHLPALPLPSMFAALQDASDCDSLPEIAGNANEATVEVPFSFLSLIHI